MEPVSSTPARLELHSVPLPVADTLSDCGPCIPLFVQAEARMCSKEEQRPVGGISMPGEAHSNEPVDPVHLNDVT